MTKPSEPQTFTVQEEFILSKFSLDKRKLTLNLYHLKLLLDEWEAFKIEYNNRNRDLTITIEEIAETCCKYYTITFEQFRSKSRKHEIVLSRQWYCYWSKKLTKRSLAEIANYVSQDHANVCHALRTINNLLETDYDSTVVHGELQSLISKKKNIEIHDRPVLKRQPMKHKPKPRPEPIILNPNNVTHSRFGVAVPQSSKYLQYSVQ